MTGIAALDHPVSRGVYLLGAKGAWVSRDDVAAALDVPRSVAAFHLDKLVDAGLLEVRFERRTGRGGPGAGRPAKLYRRAAPGVELSLPERRYDLAGALLAQALEATAAGAPVGEAVARVAHDAGRRAGAEAADDAGRPRRRADRRAVVVRALERQGYEPRTTDREVALANCPFHDLAESHRSLVCGKNLELLAGLLEGAGATDVLEPRLAPEPGWCCVRLSSR